MRSVTVVTWAALAMLAAPAGAQEGSGSTLLIGRCAMTGVDQAIACGKRWAWKIVRDLRRRLRPYRRRARPASAKPKAALSSRQYRLYLYRL
jgi:hypothetical protein